MIFTDTLYVDLEIELSQVCFELEVEQDPVLELELDMSYIVNEISGEEYTGEYTVDPSFNSIILPTNNKVLRDDVTVLPIGVSRVSNPYGGITVYIG